jgi:hypothetical protein
VDFCVVLGHERLVAGEGGQIFLDKNIAGQAYFSR